MHERTRRGQGPTGWSRAGGRGAGAQRRADWPRRSRGYSLAELTVVVAILALVAAVALPSSSVAGDQQRELAAAELADAYRFARDEARRTGTEHGVSIEADGVTVRVFRLDNVSTPPVPVYDVQHPITKQKFLLQVGGGADWIKVSSPVGSTIGTCGDVKSLAFDVHGTLRCLSPLSTLYRAASVAVTAGGVQTTVAIDGFSGRVAVQ